MSLVTEPPVTVLHSSHCQRFSLFPFLRPLVKGSVLTVRTSRQCRPCREGLAVAGVVLGSLTRLTGCLRCWLRKQSGQGGSRMSPALRSDLSLAEPLFLPPVKQGWGDYSTHPASLKHHFRKTLSFFFLPYLDSGERKKKVPSDFPCCWGCREKLFVNSWAKK